jgi:hypothetical protein
MANSLIVKLSKVREYTGNLGVVEAAGLRLSIMAQGLCRSPGISFFAALLSMGQG